MCEFDYTSVAVCRASEYLFTPKMQSLLTISQVNTTFIDIPAFYTKLKVTLIFARVDDGVDCLARTQRKMNYFFYLFAVFLLKNLLQLEASYRNETPDMTDSNTIMRLFYWS